MGPPPKSTWVFRHFALKPKVAWPVPVMDGIQPPPVALSQAARSNATTASNAMVGIQRCFLLMIGPSFLAQPHRRTASAVTRLNEAATFLLSPLAGRQRWGLLGRAVGVVRGEFVNEH